MNFSLNPEGGFALFFSENLEKASADIGDEGQEIIHVEEDQENDEDQEKGKKKDKHDVDPKKVLKCKRGKEKDHQDDEKIIDPRNNQGSQPFGHADPADPIEEIGIGEFSEFGGKDHEG
jgi:hypothetical protein